MELLHGAPYLKLLATSRLRLNVAKEEVYPLGGLQYASYADPQAAAHCAAVSLFASGARRARPEFELGDHNLRAVSEICAQVQGMPLAILLATAWVEVLSPAEILAEMRLSLDFLQAEWADLPQRQRSVRLTFDYSWNLLDEDERHAFQALCVFRGAFTRQAALTVSGAGANELRRLADKSLLMPMPGEWFSVHELLRQYGLEKLKENPDESTRVHGLYSIHYLEKLAEWERGLKGARQVETLSLMDAKINDLRLAWDLACNQADRRAFVLRPREPVSVLPAAHSVERRRERLPLRPGNTGDCPRCAGNAPPGALACLAEPLLPLDRRVRAG